MENWRLNRILKETVLQWLDDNSFKLAAALSYYTLFSIGPLIFVSIGLAGLFFGEEAARGELADQIKLLVGETAAGAVQSFLAESAREGRSRMTTGVGIGVLFVGATTMFWELRSDLNIIWKVPVNRSFHIGHFVLRRLFTFVMVLLTGILLLVSLIISAALSAATTYFSHFDKIPASLYRSLDVPVSYVLGTFVITLIFKFLPEAKVGWRESVIGGLVTSLLFTVGKIVIGIYLARAGVGSAYGASASVIILLLWTYYSSLILLFGAELTHVLGQKPQRLA